MPWWWVIIDYILDNDYKLIDWILNNIPHASDFSIDVLPNLMNKINVWDVDEFFIDIGTPESLEYANNFLDNKKSKRL